MIDEKLALQTVRVRTTAGARNGIYIGRRKGRKYDHLEAIYLDDDGRSPHGVRVRPVDSTTLMYPLERDGKPYPLTDAASTLLRSGERWGISNGARETLEAMASGALKIERTDEDRSKDMTTSKQKAKSKSTKKKAVKSKSESKKSGKGKAKAKTKTAGKQGVGAYVQERILAGDDNAAVLDRALKKFPGAKTKAHNISWYRSKLRKEGNSV